MTDRELLEAAAKAAGFGDALGNVCWTNSEYPRNSGKFGALWNYVGHMDTAELWNPLTDDGDALRMAVTLGMNVFTGYSNMTAEILSDSDEPSIYESEDIREDKCAATRRAIVRAAAMIGGAK